MKPRISLLSALVICAAFAIGWWLGARTENARVAAIEERYAREVKEVEAITAASYINDIYYDATVFPELQSIGKKHWMIHEILFLARTEPYSQTRTEPYYESDDFLRYADEALDLLGVSDLDEFVAEVHRTPMLAESKKSPFTDPKHEEHHLVTDFVRRTFAWRRARPGYPGRILIDAIHQDDPNLLATAFSTRMRKHTNDWTKRLDAYSSQIEKKFGNTSLIEFGFAGINLSGESEIGVAWKGKEYRTFKIIKEEDGWKLDEY